MTRTRPTFCSPREIRLALPRSFGRSFSERDQTNLVHGTAVLYAAGSRGQRPVRQDKGHIYQLGQTLVQLTREVPKGRKYRRDGRRCTLVLKKAGFQLLALGSTRIAVRKSSDTRRHHPKARKKGSSLAPRLDRLLSRRALVSTSCRLLPYLNGCLVKDRYPVGPPRPPASPMVAPVEMEVSEALVDETRAAVETADRRPAFR